jgi:hypothetical protein
MPTLIKLRQENPEFEVSLGYLGRSLSQTPKRKTERKRGRKEGRKEGKKKSDFEILNKEHLSKIHFSVQVIYTETVI